MKIRATVLFCLFAGIASAQSTIRPGGGSGGSSTITAGTTATSGCTDGGFLYSLTSLVRCGANAINTGSTVTIGNGISGTNKALIVNNATSTGNIIEGQDNGTAVFRVADGGGVSIGGAAPVISSAVHGSLTVNGSGTGNIYLNNSTSGVTSNDGLDLSESGLDAYLWNFEAGKIGFATSNTERASIASTGAFTIGTSALGTTVVPLTVTPGTGNTANIQNWTSSASAVLSYMDSAARFYPVTIAFASLGTPANGALVYCSDCAPTTPFVDSTCTSGGTGAIAARLNGAWKCNN